MIEDRILRYVAGAACAFASGVLAGVSVLIVRDGRWRI